jgi:hypothetical protein
MGIIIGGKAGCQLLIILLVIGALRTIGKLIIATIVIYFGWNYIILDLDPYFKFLSPISLISTCIGVAIIGIIGWVLKIIFGKDEN